MFLAELIAMIDEIKPNQYTKEQKVRWLSEIEGIVVDDVLNNYEGNDIEFTSYEYDSDMEKELLVPERFSDIYINYINAKIDFQNMETEQYNNDVAMFEASMEQFKKYYIRTHMPKQKGHFCNY